MPKLTGIVETALYVEDLTRSVEFYETVFQLKPMFADDRLCSFEVPGSHVLLLFRKGASVAPIPTPGGLIPPHDGSGHLHMAFSVAASELAGWEQWLRQKGIPIESIMAWRGGGRSLYLRDPDGHLLELATPGIWPNY